MPTQAGAAMLFKRPVRAVPAQRATAQAQAPQTIVFWYHFDNPEQTKVMDTLVAEFQAKNPTIKVDAQNIPWNN